MKVGIRFSDNDFGQTLRAFVAIFIVPTFKDIGDGHMVSHLTTSQIVDLFNTHCKHLHRYERWMYGPEWDYTSNKSKLEDNMLLDYLTIHDMDVYWDDKTDVYITDWNANNNGEFIWTDGKKVFVT